MGSFLDFVNATSIAPTMTDLKVNTQKSTGGSFFCGPPCIYLYTLIFLEPPLKKNPVHATDIIYNIFNLSVWVPKQPD